MEQRTWITVGAAGTLGLGLVAAGALATANAMDVDDATQVAQGGVVLGSGLVEQQGVTIRVTDGHASVVSAPTASSAPAAPAPTSSAPSAPAAPAPTQSAISAASPVAAPAPAPAPAPDPAPAPAPVWDSAPSAASPVSPVSAPSGD